MHVQPQAGLIATQRKESEELHPEIKKSLHQTTIALGYMARTLPDASALDYIRSVILDWCTPGKSNIGKEDKRLKDYRPDIGRISLTTPLRRLCSPVVVSNSPLIKRRRANQGQRPKQRKKPKVVKEKNNDGLKALPAFTLEHLCSIQIIPKEYQCVHFGAGQDEDAKEWLLRNMGEYTGNLGFQLQRVQEYYEPSSGPKTKQLAVYAVDTISFGCKEGVFTWHASQCQENDAWFPPGPYVPRTKSSVHSEHDPGHYDDYKWRILPSIVDVLTRKGVTLTGLNIKAQVKCIQRTFFFEEHQSQFAPVVCEIRSHVEGHSVFGKRLPKKSNLGIHDLVKATVQMDMVGKTRDEVHGLVGCSRAC